MDMSAKYGKISFIAGVVSAILFVISFVWASAIMHLVGMSVLLLFSHLLFLLSLGAGIVALWFHYSKKNYRKTRISRIGRTLALVVVVIIVLWFVVSNILIYFFF